MQAFANVILGSNSEAKNIAICVGTASYPLWLKSSGTFCLEAMKNAPELLIEIHLFHPFSKVEWFFSFFVMVWPFGSYSVELEHLWWEGDLLGKGSLFLTCSLDVLDAQPMFRHVSMNEGEVMLGGGVERDK